MGKILRVVGESTCWKLDGNGHIVVVVRFTLDLSGMPLEAKISRHVARLWTKTVQRVSDEATEHSIECQEE